MVLNENIDILNFTGVWLLSWISEGLRWHPTSFFRWFTQFSSVPALSNQSKQGGLPLSSLLDTRNPCLGVGRWGRSEQYRAREKKERLF